VSPLKHQPENPDSDSDGKAPEHQGAPGLPEGPPGQGKEEPDKPGDASSSDGMGRRGVAGEAPPPGGAVMGELEHYDLDMDEILDVPYIKSCLQASTLPRRPAPPRPGPAPALGGTLDRKHGARQHQEALSLASYNQVCVCL